MALAGAAFLTARRLPLRVPVAGLALLTAFTLIAEQLVGAPLSVVSLISYSPLLGARYYGMGNEAAAMAFGATMVGVALLLDQWPDAAASEKMRRWGIAVVGAVFVGVAAAPFLGANVGVAIWGTTGFAIAWLLFSGRAITAKRVAVTALLVVVVIAAFSAFDLLGSGEQTHLGRALTGAEQGGLGTLWTIVARKADANARVLSTTGLTWILAAVVGLAVFARWRPGSDWPALMAENPHFAKAATAATIARRGGVLLGGLGCRDTRAHRALRGGRPGLADGRAASGARSGTGRWRVTPWVSVAITLVFLAVGAIVVPWVGMRMLVPTLESADAAAVTNYRGRRVVYGLGLVWVLWVIGVQFSAALLELVSFRAWSAWSFPPSGAGITDLAAPVLVLGAFALGFADDVFGTSAERGFRGHIAALGRGRLTTGGLKLLGIGLLAAAVTLPAAFMAPAQTPLLVVAGEWLLSTLAIALSANFVNLTDLRPGRALKVYSAVATVLRGASRGLVRVHGEPAGAGPTARSGGGRVALRPRRARHARRRRCQRCRRAARLGRGADACLVVGTRCSTSHSMLALNVASEKISFSRVIDKNRVLSWLDGLGRLPAQRTGH